LISDGVCILSFAVLDKVMLPACRAGHPGVDIDLTATGLFIPLTKRGFQDRIPVSDLFVCRLGRYR
jgi:hypothetical protein